MKPIGIDVAKNSFVVAYPSKATGTYSSLIVYMLCSVSIPVSLVNPKQIKHFGKMMLLVTKTDKLDAKLISMYGEKMNPPLYKMPSAAIQTLRQQRTMMRQLKKQLHMLKNVEESLDALPRAYDWRMHINSV